MDNDEDSFRFFFILWGINNFTVCSLKLEMACGTTSLSLPFLPSFLGALRIEPNGTVP